MRVRDALVFIAGKAKYFGQLDRAVRYNPIVRRTVRSVLADYRAANPNQQRAIIDHLSGTIIERARQTPYGRRFSKDLAAWPVLSKEQVRDCPRDFVTPGFLRVPAATGGTTGIPLRLYRSLSCITAEQVFLDDLLAPHGLSWGQARVAVLRGDAIKRLDDHDPPFGEQKHGGRRLILSTPHLTAASLGWYVDRLAGFKPDILFSVPTNIANLLMLVVRSGRKLRIPIVVVSSDRLEPGLGDMIERELGATIIEYYGLSERSAFAVRRGPSQWFFEPTYGKAELVTSPGEKIVADQRHVQIIATGYWNTAQPLIRYDTGDRVLVPDSWSAADLEAVANGERSFLGIAGRENEFILAPDGRRVFGLNMIPREVRNVLQIQVVQDAPDHSTIRVLATPDFGRADRERLIANAKAELPSSVGADVEVVERLETTTGGKTPLVIRRINVYP
jgi:phenylacetate-CoA ligase